MTLQIHRAERTDLLADGLAELLATPLADLFAEELVVVPSPSSSFRSDEAEGPYARTHA